MFTQRKTNSYDLVGTNARNSDCSIQSNNNNYPQDITVGRISFEKLQDQVRLSNTSAGDSIFMPANLANYHKRQNSNFGCNNEGDFVDQILNNNSRASNNNRPSLFGRPSRSSDRGSNIGGFNFAN